MTIKLLKKGIKINGEYFPAHYSSSRNHVNGNATIYIKTSKHLPQEVYKYMDVRNETDQMVDYFEQDLIRIPSTSPFFNRVEELARG